MASMKHAMQLFCELHKDEILTFHRSYTQARFAGQAPVMSQRQFIARFLESKSAEVVQTDPLKRNQQNWPVKDWLFPTFEFVFKKWVTKFVIPQIAMENTKTPEQAAELDELLNNTIEAVADGSDLTQMAAEYGVPANTFRAMLRQAAKRRPELDEKLKEALDDSYENSVNEYRMLLTDMSRTPQEKALAKEALQARRLVVEQMGSRFGVNNNVQGSGTRKGTITGIAIDFTYGDQAHQADASTPADPLALPSLPPLPSLPSLSVLETAPPFMALPDQVAMLDEVRA